MMRSRHDTPNLRRTYDFALSQYRPGFLFDAQPPKHCPNGITAREAFFAVDTLGVSPHLLPCCQPIQFSRAIIGKKQLNWHIKQWAESFAEWTLFKHEFAEWFPDYPPWVWKAVKAQGQRIRRAAYRRQTESSRQSLRATKRRSP